LDRLTHPIHLCSFEVDPPKSQKSPSDKQTQFYSSLPFSRDGDSTSFNSTTMRSTPPKSNNLEFGLAAASLAIVGDPDNPPSLGFSTLTESRSIINTPQSQSPQKGPPLSSSWDEECDLCGEPYRDWFVQNEHWNQLHTGVRQMSLCQDCYIKQLSQSGVDTEQVCFGISNFTPTVANLAFPPPRFK